VSGKAGQHPGRWIWKLIRGGDLERGVCVVPGKVRGRCLDPDCGWPGPFGDTPHNIGRSLFRHTRATGHRTRIAVVELTEYRRPA
jgi:hypothetical protein